MRHVIAVLIWAVFIGSSAAYSSLPGGVDIEVVSDRGDSFLAIPYTNFRSGGTLVWKRYLEARKGENYNILVRNNTPERIGAVIAIDGRNIIDGSKSTLGHNEKMYIVDPFGSAKLEGWRTGEDKVHRFYFTDLPDSYSARTFGDTSAMGVMAIAVYREKPRPELHFEHGKERAGSGAPAAPRSKMFQDSAGTGFGNETYSPVEKVEFEPEGTPSQKILVKYEWRKVLCRKGMLKCRPDPGNRLWDDANEYAPFPPDYR